MNAGDPETVVVEIVGHVGVVTIDRPRVRNAIDRLTAEAIAEALDNLEASPTVRAVVLTGSGSDFCAGMDLKAFSRSGERPISAGRGAFGIVERPPALPTVAAVEGRALGGGFEMALACDLIVASRDAQFALPEVRRGLVASAGGLLRLPRQLPRNLAMELVMRGSSFPAIDAHRFGLVNCLTAPGEAREVAISLAAEIAENAPLAVRTAKWLVATAVDWPVEEGFARQAPYAASVRASSDAAEGARAFVEKRNPVWTGE